MQACQFFKYNKNSVPQSPEYEIPARTVPNSGCKKNNEEIKKIISKVNKKLAKYTQIKKYILKNLSSSIGHRFVVA